MASSTERKKPDLNNLAPGLVTIRIKGYEYWIRVNKELAFYHSKYLRRAFEGEWKEAQTGEIELSDTTDQAIKLFHWWLAAGNLYIQGYPGPTVDDYVELWILCDVLDVPVCQNSAIEQIVLAWKQSQVSDIEPANRVWECTHSESALRRLFLDQITFNVRMSPDKTEPDEFTPEIWRDVVIHLKKQIVPPGHGLLMVDLEKYMVGGPDAKIPEEVEPEKKTKESTRKRKRGRRQEETDARSKGRTAKSKKTKQGKNATNTY